MEKVGCEKKELSLFGLSDLFGFGRLRGEERL